jgi:uncharacterized protein
VKHGYDGLRLRIYVHEVLRHDHQPLYKDLVLRARREGLAGATVFHCIEGFGGHRHIHTNRLVDAADNLPVIIEIIDRPEAIRRFARSLDDIIEHGTVTISPVQIVQYSERVGGVEG